MRKQEAPRYGLLTVVIFVTLSRVCESKIASECEQQSTCKDCVQYDPRCSWCGDLDNETLTNPMTRCRLHTTNEAKCQNITNPGSHLVYVRNEDFTPADPNDTAVEKTYTQLKPQNITVKLRKGQSTKVNITFRKVIDYPLDIYYVMDLSFSMNDDLQKLQDLGTGLFDEIRKQVTKNVQLGFGSFVDKVMMPFTSTVPAQLKNPCESQENKSDCAPPFGFRHQMSITGNSTEFADAIKATKISGNIDIPEGSFDALMQIAVCEHIKWRDGATRVILLTTDASPHMAMDGKLAAILEANDMKCHLERVSDSTMFIYQKSKYIDYPSLGQLRDVFQKNKIHSIFAVTADVEPLYSDFPSVLGSDAYVATLASDSQNIIPLINKTYSQLKGRLVLQASKIPSNVQHQFRTFCPGGSPAVGDVMQCDGIEIGDEVVFELEFTAKECRDDLTQGDKIVLSSSSLQDEVTINFEYLCECECQSQAVENSSDCNGKGSLTCGLCECNSEMAGSLCQCARIINGSDVLESCKFTGSTEQCEGRGTCECGVCKRCQTGYDGNFCECQTTGCPSSDGKVCGGKDKGKCLKCPDSNEKCRCIGDYTIKESDKTCTCHPDLCKANKTKNEICSGNGECNCDKCICTDSKWAGKFCSDCKHPDCTGIDQTCDGEVIRKCAECKSKSNVCDKECTINSFIVYSNVGAFPYCGQCMPSSTSADCVYCKDHNESAVARQCDRLYSSGDGCSFHYQIVWRKDSRFHVYVKDYTKDDCPQPVPVTYIVLPVVGGIVLIGIIALIVWKVITTLRDKRQYEEFLEEEKKRKWTKVEVSTVYLCTRPWSVCWCMRAVAHPEGGTGGKCPSQAKNYK